jgi:hypothetical protein
MSMGNGTHSDPPMSVQDHIIPVWIPILVVAILSKLEHRQ